jgi:hypothetical protein
MAKTVNFKRLKTVPEQPHILRWEDDGGAVVEIDNQLPQPALETITPLAMDVGEERLLLEEKRPCYIKVGSTFIGEPE